MNHANMNKQVIGKSHEQNMGGSNTEFELQDMLRFVGQPSEFNQNASSNIKTLNTKTLPG